MITYGFKILSGRYEVRNIVKADSSLAITAGPLIQMPKFVSELRSDILSWGVNERR